MSREKQLSIFKPTTGTMGNSPLPPPHVGVVTSLAGGGEADTYRLGGGGLYNLVRDLTQLRLRHALRLHQLELQVLLQLLGQSRLAFRG